MFRLFVNDLEKALYNEAAECAVLSFLTVKIKAHCKGTAKILNVSALKRTNTRLGRVNRIKKVTV